MLNKLTVNTRKNNELLNVGRKTLLSYEYNPEGLLSGPPNVREKNILTIRVTYKSMYNWSKLSKAAENKG